MKVGRVCGSTSHAPMKGVKDIMKNEKEKKEKKEKHEKKEKKESRKSKKSPAKEETPEENGGSVCKRLCFSAPLTSFFFCSGSDATDEVNAGTEELVERHTLEITEKYFTSDVMEVMMAAKRIESQLISRPQKDSILQACKNLAALYTNVKEEITNGAQNIACHVYYSV